MDFKKSIKIGTFLKGITIAELAERMQISRQWLNNVSKREVPPMYYVNLAAECLEMKTSEFIALGED